MSRLITVLLIPAALALCSTAGVAKNIKGAPKALVGFFAEEPEIGCTPFGYDTTRIDFYGDEYNTCGGTVCVTKVVSHTKTRTGYVLHTIGWNSKGPPTPQRITVINKNLILYHYPKGATKLHRCKEGRPGYGW